MTRSSISVDENTRKRFIQNKGLYQSMQKAGEVETIDSSVFLNALLEMYENVANAARELGAIPK